MDKEKAILSAMSAIDVAIMFHDFDLAKLYKDALREEYNIEYHSNAKPW